MIKVIIILVSIVVSIIIGTSITIELPETINFPLWEFTNPIINSITLSIIVVTVEIIIFAIIDKKKLTKSIENGQFYEGRIVSTIIDDIGEEKYYSICVDVETAEAIHHFSKIFFLSIEQVNHFENAIKEKRITSMKVYTTNLSSLSFEFDFDDFYERAGLKDHPCFIGLKPSGSSVDKTKK